MPSTPDKTPKPLFETHSLRVGYPGGREIAVPDFTLRAGEFLCVFGANGSGKTTLLKTIAGILAPRGGDILFAGASGRRPSIGFLPQQGPTQRDFPASAREVVRSGCQSTRLLRPFYTAAERRRADRAMVRLGIAGLASKPYHELSGGQRQRVLIARALAAPRDILLLDEPTAALDTETAADLAKILSAIAASGIAVVMVTHDETQAAALASSSLRLP